MIKKECQILYTIGIVLLLETERKKFILEKFL